MNSLGEMLRKEREAKGISLEEISEQTKIGVRLLRAIENHQFDRLPGGIFDRSFVRQYARYLGLDEERAVREYLQAISGGRESALLPKSAPTEERGSSASAGYVRIILTAVGLGVLVGGAVYGIFRFKEGLFPSIFPATAVAPQSPAAVPDTPSPAPEAQDVSPMAAPPAEGNWVETGPDSSSGSPITSPPVVSSETPSALPPAGEDKPSAPSSVPETAGQGVSVEIAARGTVWISITVDGEKQWQGTLRPNQTRQVQAAGSVRLTVGDAGAVALLLNGKPLPPLGRSGEVKTVTITAKGLPEPTP